MTLADAFTPEAAERSLRAYLMTVRDLCVGRADRFPDRAYTCVEAAILDRGQWWGRPTVARPADLRKLPDKECFWNADRVAKQRARRGYRYVEGFALSDIGFPCHHAWVVDGHGQVVETTWREAGHVYCGIVVPRAMLRAATLPVLYDRTTPVVLTEFWTRLEAAR